MSAPVPAPDRPGTVVLLHGLGLGAWAMARLAQALRHAGFRTLNLDYPSRTCPLEELATQWLPERLQAAGLPGGAAPLHAVTHSMGGIILRLWLREHGVPSNLRRVVMFVPPNQGTPLVNRIGHWPAFRWFTGVNGGRLGCRDGLPATLGPWPDGPELGVIAGDRPVLPVLAGWAGVPGDGKVPVASTRLAGMKQHVVLPHSHTWIQYRGSAIRQALFFLQTGQFRDIGAGA